MTARWNTPFTKLKTRPAAWWRLLELMKHVAVLLWMVLPLAAQAQPAKSFVGTVAGLRPETAEIEVKADAGGEVVGRITADTIAQRIAPGEKDLKNARTVKVTDVAAGDRVLVTLEPGTSIVRRIVVMPAADIARQQEADRTDWQKRGVAGIVSARSGNRITVKTRGLTGEVESVVTVDDRTRFKRYAPDSVKFSDAKPSRLADVSVGDQLRARGEKSEDALKVAAEEVVFGTFLVKAGTVGTVSPEAREFTIRELGSNKPLHVVLTADSQLKLMPAFPAMTGGAARGGMPAGLPPAGGRSGAAGRGGMMGGAPGGGFDINQMLEHMPAAKLEDLKPGSTVVVSSTKGARNDQLTAIMVLSNADMLIRMASMMSGSGRGATGAAGMSGPGMGSPGMGGMSGGDLNGLGGLGLSGIMQ
jgi:hypothetical protein